MGLRRGTPGSCFHTVCPRSHECRPRDTAPTIGPPGPTHDDAWVAAAAPAIEPASAARLDRDPLDPSSRSLSVTGALVALYVTTELPDIPPLAETTVLLDRHGNEVAKLHAEVDRN